MNAKVKITLITLIVIVGVIFYWIADPLGNYMPRCLFRSLTGFQCPGCGSQRFLHALLHGNVAEAVSYNYIFALFIPLIIFLLLLQIYRRKYASLYARVYTPVNIIIILGIIVAWTVLRNILSV
jgi:hypothetical protein